MSVDNYHVLEAIGEGSFGKVYKGRRKSTGQLVAMKFIVKRGKAGLSLLRQEISILQELNHENIILLLDWFETNTEICVVTEFAHGELFQVLEDDKRLPESIIRRIAKELVAALEYLHSNHVIHRDMKPQNILIGTGGSVKLCDFGFARSLSANSVCMNSIKGTPLYMAPELVLEKAYNHRADLWSLGVILYELFVGHPPFYTKSIYTLIQKIVNDPVTFPDDMSKTFQSFVLGLLQKNPDLRLTWPNLLDHPFVKETEEERSERMSHTSVHRYRAYGGELLTAIVTDTITSDRLCNSQFLFRSSHLQENTENLACSRTPTNKSGSPPSMNKTTPNNTVVITPVPWTYAVPHDPDAARRLYSSPVFRSDVIAALKRPLVETIWITLLNVLRAGPAPRQPIARAFLSAILPGTINCLLLQHADLTSDLSAMLQCIDCICAQWFGVWEEGAPALNRAPILSQLSRSFIPIIPILLSRPADRPIVLAILWKVIHQFVVDPFSVDAEFSDAIDGRGVIDAIVSMISEPAVASTALSLIGELLCPIDADGMRVAFPLGGEQTNAFQSNDVTQSISGDIGALKPPIPYWHDVICSSVLRSLGPTSVMDEIFKLFIETHRPDRLAIFLRIFRQAAIYSSACRAGIVANTSVVERLVALTGAAMGIDSPNLLPAALSLLVLTETGLVTRHVDLGSLFSLLFSTKAEACPVIILSVHVALTAYLKNPELTTVLTNARFLAQLVSIVCYPKTKSAGVSLSYQQRSVGPNIWETAWTEINGTCYGILGRSYFDAALILLHHGLRIAPDSYLMMLHNSGLWAQLANGLHVQHLWNWLSPHAIILLIDLFHDAIHTDIVNGINLCMSESIIAGAIGCIYEFRLAKMSRWPEQLDGGARKVADLTYAIIRLLDTSLTDCANIDPVASMRIRKSLHNVHVVQHLITALSGTEIESLPRSPLALLARLVGASKFFARQFVDYNGLQMFHANDFFFGPTSPHKSIMDVLSILCTLARSDVSNYQHLHRSNMYRYLIMVLTNSRSEIRASACILAGNLCRYSPFFYRHLLDNGVLPHLMECFKDQDAQVRKFAAFAIGNAVYHSDDLCKAIAPCIPDLVAVLTGPLSNNAERRIATNAAGALGNLVRFTDIVVPEIQKAKCLEALVQCIGSSAANAKVRFACMHCLATLCNVEACRQYMARVPYEQALVDAVAQMPESDEPIKLARRIRNKMHPAN